jgi:hypothetical protein
LTVDFESAFRIADETVERLDAVGGCQDVGRADQGARAAVVDNADGRVVGLLAVDDAGGWLGVGQIGDRGLPHVQQRDGRVIDGGGQQLPRLQRL